MDPNKNELNLRAMAQVEKISQTLKTISWLWGGFTSDIYENRLLRDHDDLDYLTLNLHSLIPQFVTSYQQDGWQVGMLENGDLKVIRAGIKIHFGHVELSGKARWTHNGDKGSLWFPTDWLKTQGEEFCGLTVHVVEPEFQYVLLERPHLLNPKWICREKDIVARQYLRSRLESEQKTPKFLYQQVSEVG